MSPTATASPRTHLPRADLPRLQASRKSRGPFPWIDLHLSGLRPAMWILLGYLFVMVTAVDEEWPSIGRFQPTLVLGVLIVAACIGECVARGLTRTSGGLFRTSPGVWWSALLVASILSTIWAYKPWLAKEAEREYVLAMLAFPALVLLVHTRRDFVLVCLVLVAGNALYLARSFTEFLNGRIVGASDLARMVGAGQSNADPNTFAASIVFSLPLVVWVAVQSRSFLLRAACAGYGALGAYCIVMTRSRAGLVILGLVMLWALTVIPSRALRLGAAAALLVFGVLLAGKLSAEELQRYETIVASDTYAEEESTRGRVDGYVVGARILQDRPLFGVGLGNWSAYRVARVDGDKLMPHTLGGQVMAELGLVGTIAFLGYLLASFGYAVGHRARLRRSPDRWDLAVNRLLGAMLVVLFLLLISGLAAHNLAREAWAVVPALMIAAVRCRPETGEETSNVA